MGREAECMILSRRPRRVSSSAWKQVMEEITVSEQFEPEVIVLYCGRGLADGDYLPEGMKKGDGFKSRFVMMPCSSKVETEYLLKLIENGTDGVMLVVCPKAECQFMIGSTRAENRMKYAQSLLGELGMDSGRLAVIEGFNLSADTYMKIAEEYAGRVKPLGENPMKRAGQATVIA